jgi:cation diffusion facilitator family transporter
LTGPLRPAEIVAVPLAPKTQNAVERTTRSPAVRATLLAILGLNAVVVIVKVAIGIRTGALAVLGAALESGLDMLNNVMGLLLVSLAARAPDDDHPYGHDKFETLGALGIVGFLSISCFELLREGVHQLLQQSPPNPPEAKEVWLLAATVLINIGVVYHERRRGRELNSAFLLADASHTLTDIYVTGLAVASLLLARIGYGRLDAVLAIVVALLIARTGYQILRETVPILVDQRGADAEELRAHIASIAGVEEVRAVRSRLTASGTLFAEVTIGVSADTSVAEAHQLADAVEDKIENAYGAAEVTVHVEPA